LFCDEIGIVGTEIKNVRKPFHNLKLNFTRQAEKPVNPNKFKNGGRIGDHVLVGIVLFEH